MRTELERRPLLIIALGLIIGLSLREQPLHVLLLLTLIFVLQSLQSRMISTAAFLLGALLAPAFPASGLPEERFVSGVATVVSMPKVYPEAQTCDIQIQGQKLQLTAKRDPPLVLGDKLEVRGWAKPLREGTEHRHLRNFVVGRIKPSFLRVTERGPWVLQVSTDLRESFVAFTSRTMRPDYAASVDALCFNVDGGLEDETIENLQRTGTLHIISASGLHVFFLAFAVQAALALLPIPRGWQLGLLFAALMFYAAATGLRPPILRAVVMAMLTLSAYMWRREGDLLSALSLAAILFVLAKPQTIYDIGFQYSFLTVAAIALFMPPESDRPTTAIGRFVASTKDGLRVGWVATLASAPITAYYFGIFSLISLVANVLVALAVGPIVVVAMASFLIGGVWPSLAQGAMTVLVQPLASYVDWILAKLGGLTWAATQTPAFSAYWLLPLYAAFLLMWRKRVRQA